MSHELIAVSYSTSQGSVHSYLRCAEPEPILVGDSWRGVEMYKRFVLAYQDELADAGLADEAIEVLTWFDDHDAGRDPDPSDLDDAVRVIVDNFRTNINGFEYELVPEESELWLVPVVEDY